MNMGISIVGKNCPRPDFCRRRLLAGWLVTMFMLGEHQPVMAVDQITRRSDNVILRGEFVSMDVSAVTIKQSNGKSETIPVTDIRTIRFDQEPSLLAQAQSNERSGALDSALEKYRQIQSEYSGGDKRLLAELQFLVARTLVKQALANPPGRDPARKAISEFRSANKSGFRFLEATLLEAALVTEIGDTAGAKALLQEVQGSSVKGYQLQAGVQLGRVLLQASQATDALKEFDQVIQQSGGDPGSATAKFDGLLGKALCLQQQGKIDDARTVLEQVLNEASTAETRVLAEAWNRKGDCLRQLNQPKAALMAYLHVDVLYSAEPAEHAQALFYLSQLWGPTGHQDRADDAAGRLSEKYPNSTWTRQLLRGG